VKLQLRVITPENIALEEECDMVIARCMTGDMGFLPRHEATSAILGEGDVRLLNNGEDERRSHIPGGIIQIKDDVVTILTSGALSTQA
jgi:F-type H+-transporting ATPase subunit epsilon